jgi:hypothetical protein
MERFCGLIRARNMSHVDLSFEWIDLLERSGFGLGLGLDCINFSYRAGYKGKIVCYHPRYACLRFSEVRN